MRTVRIVVTDMEGTLLDETTIEIDDTSATLAVREVKRGMADRPDETTLEIGSE